MTITPGELERICEEMSGSFETKTSTQIQKIIDFHVDTILEKAKSAALLGIPFYEFDFSNLKDKRLFDLIIFELKCRGFFIEQHPNYIGEILFDMGKQDSSNYFSWRDIANYNNNNRGTFEELYELLFYANNEKIKPAVFLWYSDKAHFFEHWIGQGYLENKEEVSKLFLRKDFVLLQSGRIVELNMK